MVHTGLSLGLLSWSRERSHPRWNHIRRTSHRSGVSGGGPQSHDLHARQDQPTALSGGQPVDRGSRYRSSVDRGGGSSSCRCRKKFRRVRRCVGLYACAGRTQSRRSFRPRGAIPLHIEHARGRHQPRLRNQDDTVFGVPPHKVQRSVSIEGPYRRTLEKTLR
jgi:hypothetical protein